MPFPYISFQGKALPLLAAHAPCIHLVPYRHSNPDKSTAIRVAQALDSFPLQKSLLKLSFKNGKTANFTKFIYRFYF